MKKMLVLAAALLGFLPSIATAQINPPAGLVEFSPEQGSLAASLQAGLQTAQQGSGDVCPKEKFAGIADKHILRVLMHCAAVETAGSEEARMARAQSNAECTDSCLFNGAGVLKRSGFKDVAIGLARTGGRQLTLVGATDSSGQVLWTNEHGGVVDDRVVRKLQWEVLVTPQKAFRPQS